MFSINGQNYNYISVINNHATMSLKVSREVLDKWLEHVKISMYIIWDDKPGAVKGFVNHFQRDNEYCMKLEQEMSEQDFVDRIVYLAVWNFDTRRGFRKRGDKEDIKNWENTMRRETEMDFDEFVPFLLFYLKNPDKLTEVRRQSDSHKSQKLKIGARKQIRSTKFVDNPYLVSMRNFVN